MPSPQDPNPDLFQELTKTLVAPSFPAVLELAVYLLLGGMLALYIRFLYRRTSRNLAADSVARVFPLLTMVTIAVIDVVRSSLALSFGLVGALSIVRFRAAIKDPEELVYLFLCIGVGLSLGAHAPWLAFVLVTVATAFVLLFERRSGGGRVDAAFLTIIGPADPWFAAGARTALDVVHGLHPLLTVQRCEVDGDEGQLRVHLHRLRNRDCQQLLGALREQLPDCRVSYVDAEALS